MYTGLRLTSFKHLCKNAATKPMPAPNHVKLLLTQHTDALLRPCVKLGDTVARGQVVAKPDRSYSAWLHASVSGTVQSVSDQFIAIENDHQNRSDPSNRPINDWHGLSPIELIAHLAQGGIAGLGGAGYSTAAKLAVHAKTPIETLIINGMECEPYITCDDYLMREQSASIINGVQILLLACGATRAIIAIEDDKPVAIEAIRSAVANLNDQHIEVRVLSAAYPQGDEGQLIRLILSKEIPHGCLPSAINVLVQNIATAHACARWIVQGQPLITRNVTITGHGVKECSNIEVPIGTACKDVIAFSGGYQGNIKSLIMGGTLMGRSLESDDIPITKASNCVIVATEADIGSDQGEQPCIRCGECAFACPVNLLPQQLLMYVRSQNTSAAVELGLNDCIECGCCDIVCPSHIMLASRFRQSKRQLPTAL